MKAKAYITINIDTDKPVSVKGYNGNTSVNQNRFDTKKNAWVSDIYVGDDVVKTNSDPLTVTAHEIGHILARMFGLPGAENSPHYHPLVQMGIMSAVDTPELQQAAIKEESEAWDVAGKLGVPIDPATREFALDSYKDPTGSLEEMIEKKGKVRR